VKIRIGFGLVNYPFEDGKGFFRWVEMLERSGVDSVWQSDRLISSDNYLESLSALASLAGCTERIKFGMNAIVAPLRDPLVLAKQCATIDYLSGGRLLPMFGVGYPKAAEWAATGRSSEHRGSRANEMFELLTRLWSEERVTFEGRFYQYRDATIAPRPVQQPLPLWIGGNSDAAIKRTARLGTGWIGGIAAPLTWRA
jgi:alkanesulfonate monooxygenase SsuD/methylene tetrahydromethanopterin reductase-like flavin-dependent oxidoreductase (luciferase family)